MNIYAIGQRVTLSAEFTISGVDTDTATATCTVKDPAGTITTPTVTHDTVGKYHATFDVTLPGVHYYGFKGDTVKAAAEGSFAVALSTLS